MDLVCIVIGGDSFSIGVIGELIVFLGVVVNEVFWIILVWEVNFISGDRDRDIME